MQTQPAARADIADASLLSFGHHQDKACGWFDSSFELRSGLQVDELSDAQLLALWAECKGASAAALH